MFDPVGMLTSALPAISLAMIVGAVLVISAHRPRNLSVPMIYRDPQWGSGWLSRRRRRREMAKRRDMHVYVANVVLNGNPMSFGPFKSRARAIAFVKALNEVLKMQYLEGDFGSSYHLSTVELPHYGDLLVIN